MSVWRKCVFKCQEGQPLFTLPKDETVRKQWLDFIFGNNPWPKKMCYVCANHFREDCFQNKSLFDTGLISRLSLKANVVPTIKTTSSEPAKVRRTVGCFILLE